MKFVTLIVLACTTSVALAYKDGTYSCKNHYDGLPNNIYKIQTLPISGLKSVEVPYIEVTRFSRETDGDKQSPILESHISGIAARITDSHGVDALQLLALSFEFENDQLLKCEK